MPYLSAPHPPHPQINAIVPSAQPTVSAWSELCCAMKEAHQSQPVKGWVISYSAPQQHQEVGADRQHRGNLPCCQQGSLKQHCVSDTTSEWTEEDLNVQSGAERKLGPFSPANHYLFKLSCSKIIIFHSFYFSYLVWMHQVEWIHIQQICRENYPSALW